MKKILFFFYFLLVPANSIYASNLTDFIGVQGTVGTAGDHISIDSVAVTDPDFVSTGDIDFVDTSNTVTANINTGAIVNSDINASAAIVASKLSGVTTPTSTDTFTNKTIDANGTGNSLSNVDVADLANGTDGELITWSATAVPATVAVGTSGQILTSNGVGTAPTFQTNAGTGDFSNGGDTTGSARTLGNNDNFDLEFETNGIDRITIKNDGRISFGTAGADGTFLVSDPASDGGISVNADLAAKRSHFILKNANNRKWAITSAGTFDTPNDRLSIYNADFAAEIMTFLQGGNVGISTNNPSTLFEVQGAAGAAGRITASTAELTVVDGDKLGQIDFQAPLESSGTDATLVAGSIWVEADETFDTATNTASLVFATATSETATEKMRLDSAGNLGINTTVPSATLTVQSTNSEASFGAEKVTNGDFTTDLTGWTNNGNWAQSSGTALHTAGSTNTLEQDVSVVAGNYLKISFTTSGVTAGSIVTAVGGTSVPSISDSRTVNIVIKTLSTANLSFTPTSDFDGAIDNISVTQATATSNDIVLKNDNATDALILKSGGASLSNILIGNLETGLAINVASRNVFIGTGTGRGFGGAGQRNVALGESSMLLTYAGNDMIGLGQGSLQNHLSGNQMIGIGRQAFESNLFGATGVAVGYRAGRNSSGSNIVFIGPQAGTDETADNTLIVDNQDRGTEAQNRAGALLYGLFNATATSQILTTSGSFGIGTISPDNLLHSESSTALTATITSPLRLSHITSGTATTNIGVGMEFEQEGNDGTNNVIASISAILSDAGTGTEDGDMVFATMTGASAATEKMRIDGDGNVGIGTTAPGALLSLGLAGTTSGVISHAGSTSGIVTIQPAAVAGTYTLTLPVDDGNAGEFLQTDGSGVLSFAVATGDAFSSLWYHGGEVTTTISTINTFAKITHFINTGEEDIDSNVIGDPTTDDDLTIGANGGGVFMMHLQGSFRNASGSNKNLQINIKVVLATAKTITDATNATPIVITTSAAHGLKVGDMVTISGVGGNTAANADHFISVVGSSTTFSLQTLAHVDLAGNGAYTSGGTVDGVYPGNIMIEGVVSGSDLERGAGTGTFPLVAGDVLELHVSNITDANNAVFSHLQFGVERIRE